MTFTCLFLLCLYPDNGISAERAHALATLLKLKLVQSKLPSEAIENSDRSVITGLF